MFVKDWMSRNVITADVNDSMQQAIRLMKEHKVRMLPVLRNGKVAGIVSDTDLKRASASDATSLDIHELLYLISAIKLGDIMTKDPVTVPPDYTVEETAEVLLNKKISGAPVVDERGEVVGIITRDDLFKVLISLSGLGKRGILFSFRVDDRPGSIKELTDVIRTHGGRIASILSSYDRVPEGSRVVHVRAYSIDREKLPHLVEELKGRSLLLSLVDHRDNRRQIFHELGN